MQSHWRLRTLGSCAEVSTSDGDNEDGMRAARLLRDERGSQVGASAYVIHGVGRNSARLLGKSESLMHFLHVLDLRAVRSR